MMNKTIKMYINQITLHHYYCHIGRQQVVNKIKSFYQANSFMDNINVKIVMSVQKISLEEITDLMSYLGHAIYIF